MRRIYKIAKAELFTLFYSPIAWFILVVFAFQTSLTFTELMQEALQRQTMGYGGAFLTANIFGGMRGLFTVVQNYLYLYVPLLTMGLMSREYSSGTIKLLHSSPVTARHVILGKFGAMMCYGLLLVGILLVQVIFAASTIRVFDLPAALSGLLGLYLLICAYSAIGLFMSSLTSYQVVAAIGTLVLLAVLNYMGRVWQSVELVREITWWLSISGRCNEFVAGLICSEDALY
ncbi:MAG: ABC transporter permease, partial [Odoribacteraceae bacterium]|nr:ABC transporter permease [Odoribacteraceae bacterium]